MCLIKCQPHTLIHDRIQWKCCNHEILKAIKSLKSEYDLKFYFLHMKSNENRATLKYLETITSNVKILGKKIENER